MNLLLDTINVNIQIIYCGYRVLFHLFDKDECSESVVHKVSDTPGENCMDSASA